MANTLGWVGDGDDWYAVQELDRAFALKLPPNLSHWRTVGDVWRTIEERHLAAGERDGGCHSAMAFYRLREAVARPGEPRPTLIRCWYGRRSCAGPATCTTWNDKQG